MITCANVKCSWTGSDSSRAVGQPCPDCGHLYFNSIRKVVHIPVGSKPSDYVIITPEDLHGKTCKPVSIVRCPFGPLVQWKEKVKSNCEFCGGDGEVEAHGVNGDVKDVDCPDCDGSGECYVSGGEAVWSDSDGNIVNPVIVGHVGGKETICEFWLRDWVKSKQ